MPWLHGARADAPADNKRIVVLDRPIRRRFAWQGGRRRLAAVPYLLPSDEREIHRLDFQHYLLRHALQGNFSAPITANPRGYPTSILDVGCGTGRWAIEMALQFPDASIIGVDLSPLLDEAAALERRPPNFTFVQADVLKGLPFAAVTFDYVFQRLLFLAIPALLWPGVVRELVRVTQTRGWVELVEGGVTEGGGPALATLAEWAATLSSQRGIDLGLGALVGPFLQEAGLQHVVVRRVEVPIGRLPLHPALLRGLWAAHPSAAPPAALSPAFPAKLAIPSVLAKRNAPRRRSPARQRCSRRRTVFAQENGVRAGEGETHAIGKEHRSESSDSRTHLIG